MKRRDFMRGLMTLTAGGAVSFYGNPFRPRMRFAHAQSSNKTLVVVFQDGGADGLNECVPHGLDEYYEIRPTIAIPRPGSGSGSALDLDGFFGLHPALGSLQPVFNAGDLAIFPACHYPDATRSHFDGQVNIESAEDSQDSDGWLNRYLVENPPQSAAELRAVGFSSGLPHALRGNEIVSSFSNLSNFSLELSQADEQALIQDLTAAYGQSADGRLNRELVMKTGRVTVNDLGVLAPIVNQTYNPENGATYPGSTFGRQMMQTAQLIKSDVGLEVVALSLGGWDTHSDEGAGQGSMASRLTDFADALAAFYQDLGSRQSDVVVLTMSEFGRTSVENGSEGTDHAHATTWMAMGGPVQGGQIYPHQGGDASALYPGALRSLQDVRDRYLDHSVDFRDVMGEVLSSHLGASDLTTLLPGHNYQPVGYLS